MLRIYRTHKIFGREAGDGRSLAIGESRGPPLAEHGETSARPHHQRNLEGAGPINEVDVEPIDYK